uniref:Putative harbinger transposase-derived protein n=1 Tax=Tanacetum cinerariifolium TaxID=118510 RepID=A0A699JAE1_TANCI|nr:putative harbinger transposase-derived protein [Tanacetum cinerariifolium]
MDPNSPKKTTIERYDIYFQDDAERYMRDPKAPFVVNERTYKKRYYLVDGIYATWSTFVKTFSIARDEKTLRFKRVQESARKDIERAFGVLQAYTGKYDSRVVSPTRRKVGEIELKLGTRFEDRKKEWNWVFTNE